jgi:predicted enzyme related to lactoylglutathione lyase
VGQSTRPCGRLAVERAQGIGGVFFRSADPVRLAAWYADHLGLGVEEWGGSIFSAPAGDVTVWSPFPADTSYWPEGQQAMVNYRVRDLDAVLARPRSASVEVDERVEETENGRFGWATVDPEGNRFELWQPYSS